MCVKLTFGDLNPGPCPLYLTNTYTYGVTITPNNVEKQINEPLLYNEMLTNEEVVEEPQEVTLRRSQRERQSAISDDYMIYLHESDFDIGTSKDRFYFHKP